jgi:hypothetical protein
MRRSRGLVLALVCLSLAACTGDGSGAEQSAAAPPQRTGEVVPVDVCDLVGRRQLSRAIDEPVRVVGRELEPPTLPTETCQWGREFAVGLVDVQLTPGPVALATFEAAFGAPAGDDPRAVDVGEAAYAREGLTTRTLQVFANGVVLSLEADDAPGNRLPHGALTEIADAALADLPLNPELADPRPRRPCARVDERAVAAAMGTGVRLRSAQLAGQPSDPDSPAMCSWAGLPGSVVVTVRTDPVQVTNFRANLSPRVYQRVREIPAEAWSQDNHAGDLLLFVGDALVEVTSLPGEGFSSPDVATTRGELRLGRALVRAFG